MCKKQNKLRSFDEIFLNFVWRIKITHFFAENLWNQSYVQNWWILFFSWSNDFGIKKLLSKLNAGKRKMEKIVKYSQIGDFRQFLYLLYFWLSSKMWQTLQQQKKDVPSMYGLYNLAKYPHCIIQHRGPQKFWHQIMYQDRPE